MEKRLINTAGWDLFVKNGFLYYQIQDKRGKNNVFIKTDLTESFDIPEEEFNSVKFGENFEKFIGLIGTNNDSSVIREDGSVICTGFRDYFFYFIDKEGNITEKREDIGFDNIYSFDLDSNGNIWYATPVAHCIGQHSLKDGKEIYRLGEEYESGNPLSFPEDIKIYGDFVYISDMDNNQVIQLNVETKDWIVYLKFKEQVWEYIRFGNEEIVRLKSGIYLIER